MGISKTDIGTTTVSIIATLAVWEILTWAFRIPAFILPAPSAIFIEAVQRYPLYLYHSWITFYEMVVGFLLAVAVGGWEMTGHSLPTQMGGRKVRLVQWNMMWGAHGDARGQVVIGDEGTDHARFQAKGAHQWAPIGEERAAAQHGGVARDHQFQGRIVHAMHQRGEEVGPTPQDGSEASSSPTSFQRWRFSSTFATISGRKPSGTGSATSGWSVTSVT